MVEIVLSVAAKVSEYLVDPAVRQLGYLFNYRANIEDLSQQVEKLRVARARLQHSVDEAIGNGHIIEDDVCKWMKRADEFIQNACKFLEDEKEVRKSCFNGLCPNLKSRYQLSREARKKAGVAVEIHGAGQFERVSYRAPLQEIRSAPSEALESRMLTLNEVMEALRDANLNRIGVWGMGGVGKSTLVKQVAEQAEQEKLFRKVVMVPVFQTPDFKGIQQQIADKLGMKFEEVSEQGRADRLHQRIKQENTILIILDDLWAELELEKVGIPSPDDHKGCKLVLTSRNKQVLSNEMSTQKVFRVQHLQEDETWILFENTAGDSIENPELQPIAVDVAKECTGLPIAIVTVAKALKNKNVSIWKDALQQLKSQTSTNITGMETKVYSSLKLSYEHLEGDEVKSLCLLCGLFSSDIHIRDLLKYGVGLRLFQGTNTLEEAKNRIDTLVDNLKSSNFLLETGHNAYVRMHDLVRSTARKIASEQRHVFTHQKTTVRVEEWSRIDELQVTWVKLHDCDIHELPEGLVCPKLEFFECFLKTQSAVKIPNTFFEGMKQLKVLDFSRMQLPSLPLSLQCLANLRTLCLDGCKLGDIVIIAELKKLEILSLMHSDIEQLPREIAQLTHLRLFDLKGSDKLKVIPPDVISSLFRLEDLCMENSFTQWEGEGKSNVCLAELKHLSHLTSLDIQIPDAKLLPKDIVFENLVRYRIFVGDVWSWEEIFEANSTLKLNKFDTSLHLVQGIIKLLKRTEDLHLRELCGGTNVLSKLNREGFLKLKHLNVESSPEIQCIVNSMDLTSPHGAFPVMETLSLNQLINLQEVCHGQFPTGSFGCLRKVEVEDCNGLKFLFSLSVARGLSRLEEIKVTRCKSMVEMVSQERKEIREDAVNVPLFPKLRYLTLEDLPKLSNFCFEENPVLPKPASTIVGPSTPPLNQPEIRDGQLLLSLGGNLRSLKLKNCMSLLKLFPPGLLQNLEELIVENCGQLEHVFDDEHVELLPKLGKLRLIGIPKLRHICNCGSSRNHFPFSMASAPVGNIIFPKLSNISLGSLPNLTSFVSPGYHSLQRLHHADLDTPFPVLFDERFPFGILEVLEIFGLENIKKLWPDQLLTMESFGKLKEIRVSHCRNLSSVFPTSVVQGLVQLEILEIDSCGMKEIFMEEDGSEKPNRFIFPKLIDLTLKNLKELKSFYPGKYISEWPSLKKLEVCNCDNIEILFQEMGLESNIDNQVQQPFFSVEKLAFPKLEVVEILHMENIKKIWHGRLSTRESFGSLKEIMVSHCRNLSSVFPTSVIRGLLQLKTLEVDSCGMEEIFMKEDGIKTPIGVMLPTLTYLTLKNLKKLRCFYPGKHVSKWPLLKKLEVCNCDKIEILFQEKGLERYLDNQVQQPFFLVEKLSFPNLEVLEIFHMENVKIIWHSQHSTIEFFSHLKEIRVSHCRNLLSVFPTSAIRGLLQLETLEIHSCRMEEIFVKEDGIETPVVVIFPKLTYLALKNLKELKCFYPGKHISTWPLLKKLEVCNCDKVEILFQEKGLEGNLDSQVQQPFFLVEKVAFQSLEDLDISNLDNVEKIWHNEFIADSFERLKGLSVQSCQKLQNIIPYNMLKRLSSLQILKIMDCNSVEEVFHLEVIDSKESQDIPGLQLRELCLDNLKNLKCVWNKAPQGLLTYQNLNRVQVSHCPSLKIPFPGYVVRSLLQPKEVDMKSCGVEKILAHEDVAEVVTMFLFPEVTSLTSSCLKELKCFYLGLDTLEWPMLKTLEVESCESLEILASKLDKPVEQSIFLCDKVAFPNLEDLNLSLKSKEIQDLQVLFRGLPNLKILIVENCPFLLSVFSSQYIQCLNNLKKLTVKKCDLLEEIVDLKGLDHGDVEHVEMLSKLEEVSLIDLPKLRHICNNSPPQVLCFQKLKLLRVKQCNIVTYLFSPSMVLGLVQLQDLSIEHCPAMNEIFTAEGGDTANWLQQVSCFQNLKFLQVKQCDSLMYLFPYSMALGLEQLQDLCIEHCSKMKKIIMEDGDVDNRPQQVSSLQNLKFVRVKQCDSLMYLFPPSMALGLVQLQDLCIEDCPRIKEIVTAEDRDFDNQPRQVLCFQNLKFVQVKQCHSLMYLFSSSIGLAPVQLQELCIEHCYTMKEIVTVEEGVTDEIIFPKITRVSLLKLPKLTSFYPSQTLEKIHMGDSNSALGVLFNDKVAFPNLEFLHVSGLDNVKKIWHNQLLGDSFSKLKEMMVENCNELQNLLTSNVLNWLRSLEFLKIDSCGKLIEVFDQEVINVQEDVTDTQLSQFVLDDLQQWELGKYLCLQNLKGLEVHNCGSLKNIFSPYTALGLVPLEGMKEIITQEGAQKVIDEIEFPELTSLSLQSLPSLASFYPGSHSLVRLGPGDHDILISVLFNDKVAFPCLESLNISSLGSMKKIWHYKLIENSFSKLAKVKVECCNELQNGLPLFVLKSSSLQILRIANCGKLKEVFDLEGANILSDATETQLNKLVLHGLPQLQYIWNRDPYGILTYENLNLVEILHCQVLKGQFPSCLTRDLSQLEKQLIRSRWKKDLEGKDEGEDFVFPEVTYDKLLDLKKIKGKEVVVVSESDYVGDISEDMPGSSG